jgi:ABC-type branched-subunit amino acid transport system permease subunit
MPPLAWLLIAIVAGVLAYLVGWPAWRSYQSRESRDVNTERYLQWRGRADRVSTTSTREGMTNEERRRIYAGAALAVLAVVAVLLFFAGS